MKNLDIGEPTCRLATVKQENKELKAAVLSAKRQQCNDIGTQLLTFNLAPRNFRVPPLKCTGLRYAKGRVRFRTRAREFSLGDFAGCISEAHGSVRTL